MQRLPPILAVLLLCSPAAFAAAPATNTQPIQANTDAALGIDLAGIDHSVKPGDDFFDYTNGAWLKTAVIPPDRSSTGTFFKIFELTEQHTADLIRNAGKGNPAPGGNTRKIADYYAAYMDEAGIDKRGLAGLQPELARIDAIKSRDDLARVLGSRLRADVDPINATNFHTENLFGLFVTQGLEDPSRSIPYLLQGGLGMPSRGYYLSKDKDRAANRDKYKT
ncbi:MAG: M13 family peptidase, partial [Rhodanobacteraceae bacterium]